jgi:hypothetical protein
VNKLFCSVAAFGLVAVSAPAIAQNSHCWWEQGVLACVGSFETPTSKTTTLCAYSSIDGGCTTTTEKKKQRPTYEVQRSVTVDLGEPRKAAARAATNYRDPNLRDVCPSPYRMTAADGCQLR